MDSREAAKTELTVHLRDGTTCLLRPILPDDKDRIRAGMEEMSSRSRFMRFNAAIDRLTEDQLAYLTEIDYEDHMAWGALDADTEGMPGMGVARYIRLKEEPDVAEAAITVVDRYQGRGLGTVLLGVLAQSALDAGITTFRNYVIASNAAMLELFVELGADVEPAGGGLLQVDYPLPADVTDLPDTPAGRVMRAVAEADVHLGFASSLWIENTDDGPGPASGDLEAWLDEAFGADEQLSG